jgi:hypothetical protein
MFVKIILLKAVHPLKVYQNIKLHGPRLVQVLRPPQKSERPPFWNVCSYGTMASRSPSKHITRQLVHKLIVGQARRPDGDLNSLHFTFRKERRIKLIIKWHFSLKIRIIVIMHFIHVKYLKIGK